MFGMLLESDHARVERFKQTTREKLRDVRCPVHRQPPRVNFQGEVLREMTISVSGCCARLMAVANARIASAGETAVPSASRLRVGNGRRLGAVTGLDAVAV